MVVGGGVNAASLAGGSRWRMEPSSGVEVGSRGSADQLQHWKRTRLKRAENLS